MYFFFIRKKVLKNLSKTSFLTYCKHTTLYILTVRYKLFTTTNITNTYVNLLHF